MNIHDKIEHLKEQLYISPSDDALWFELAVSYEKVEEYRKAIDCYHKVLKLEPEDDSAYYNMGCDYDILDDRETAIRCYRKAIQIYPKSFDAYYNLGLDLHDLGRVEEAEKCYMRVIRLKPDFAEVYFSLAGLKLDCGKLDEAKVYFDRLLEIDPSSLDGYFGLGVLSMQQGKPWDALNYFLLVHDANSDYPEVCSQIAYIYNQTGQYAEAVHYMEEAVAKHPDDEVELNRLGCSYMDNNELDKAADALQRAIRFNPLYGNSFFNMGLVEQARERHEQAVRYFEQCMELDPDDEECMARYAQELMAVGREEEAADIIAKLFSDPGHDKGPTE